MFPKGLTIRPDQWKSHQQNAVAFSIAHCCKEIGFRPKIRSTLSGARRPSRIAGHRLTELQIAILLFRIAITMKLGEKLRYLREVEGSLRGKERAMTQQELVRAIKAELKASMSQSYLSQIESGARPHLTNTTRQLLAKFFKVHPGYLVDDPEGYHAELMSEARVLDDKLDLWLVNGAERFPRDPDLKKALLALAKHPESRQCLLLMEALIETPGLVDRLVEVLRPAARSAKHFKVRPMEANPQVKDAAGKTRRGEKEKNR
jgi:transcriptional regulator with XRE-family HTH domain